MSNPINYNHPADPDSCCATGEKRRFKLHRKIAVRNTFIAGLCFTVRTYRLTRTLKKRDGALWGKTPMSATHVIKIYRCNLPKTRYDDFIAAFQVESGVSK